MTEVEWIEATVMPVRHAVHRMMAGEIGQKELLCVMKGCAAGMRTPPPDADPGLVASLASWADEIDARVDELSAETDRV